jgi:hypothetical protein
MEELAKSRPMQSAPSSTEPTADSQTAHTDPAPDSTVHTDPAPDSTVHTDPAPDADAPHAGPDPQQTSAPLGDVDAATAPKQ